MPRPIDGRLCIYSLYTCGLIFCNCNSSSWYLLIASKSFSRSRLNSINLLNSMRRFSVSTLLMASKPEASKVSGAAFKLLAFSELARTASRTNTTWSFMVKWFSWIGWFISSLLKCNSSKKLQNLKAETKIKDSRNK